MEISDRKDLNKLIAYSKSFRPTDLEPDFEGEYTPPGYKNIIYDAPQIIEEQFDFENELKQEQDITEEQLFQNLKNSILYVQPQDQISSDIDSQEMADQSSPLKFTQEQITQAICQTMPVGNHDLTEYNKVSEDVLQFLDQQKGRRSLFTENLKSRKCNTISISNGKPIKIYFFNTPQMVELTISRNTTVAEVLKQAIEQYLGNSEFNQTLLKYKEFPEAYEIRIVDDDFEYKADMSFAALDKKKEILSTQTNMFAIVEVNGFKVPQNQQINQMIEKISQNSNLLVLDIIIVEKDQNINSKIQLPKDSPASDIIEKLSARNKKINAIDYQLLLKTDDEENIEIDLTMPAIHLYGKLLMLVKKKWADQAELIERSPQNIIENSEESIHQAPLNHIQAFKYEKFSVIKINERGKRQDRILGIDQFRIYNMNKKSTLNIFEKLLNNKETGTKYPERLIEDIVDMRIANQHLFITFKQDGNEKERFKELRFDALDSKIALLIFTKINFIRDFQQQTKIRKTRSFSQKLE